MLLETAVHHPSPEEESLRKSVLAELEILDSEPEMAFDQLAKILAATTGCQSAWITFLDGDREWAKARVGISMTEIPRTLSPSRFVIDTPSVTVLRFPVVEPSPLGSPIAFFAGAPIRVRGTVVGTVAAMDTESRELSPNQALALSLVADLARTLLDARSLTIGLEKDLANSELASLVSAALPAGQLENKSNAQMPSDGNEPGTSLQAPLGTSEFHEPPFSTEKKIPDIVARLQTAHMDLQAQRLELSLANARLQILAETDGLTGLRNRRTLVEEMTRRLNEGEGFSFVLLDLDNFKAFNDRHGHVAGDEALRTLAKLLEMSVRGSDMAARYGGEEFALLIGDGPGTNALEIAERLRRSVERNPWPLTPLTLSAGVSTLSEDVSDPETIIRRADSALYAAKRMGKNRVLAWVSG